MTSSEKLKVVDLNYHLSCILCGGYFVDATTIIECLHSFCRACIVRYLETSRYCPICEVEIHKAKPLRCIRPDKSLQDVVYKLVPNLFQNEMKQRRELYASQPPEALQNSRDPEDRGEIPEDRYIYTADELFCLSLRYRLNKQDGDCQETESTDKGERCRYLKCAAAMKMFHMKKFIRFKYDIPKRFSIIMEHSLEPLKDDYSLMDIAYIYDWKRNGPLALTFRIVDQTMLRPSKQLQHYTETVPETKCEKNIDDLGRGEPVSEKSEPTIAPIVEIEATISEEIGKTDEKSGEFQSLPNVSSVAVESVSKTKDPSDAVVSTGDRTDAPGEQLEEKHSNQVSVEDQLNSNKPSQETESLSALYDIQDAKTKISDKEEDEIPKISSVKSVVSNSSGRKRKISKTSDEKRCCQKEKIDESTPLKVPKLTIPLTSKILEQAAQHARDDNKTDSDNDLFEGRLVIAEDSPSHDAKDNFFEHKDDIQISMKDDDEMDSGRGSDISCRIDDDLRSPTSICSPDAEKPNQFPTLPEPLPKTTNKNISKAKTNVSKPGDSSTVACSLKDNCGALDLSVRPITGLAPISRRRRVANPPPVMDTHRQTTAYFTVPKLPIFTSLPSVMPQVNICRKPQSARGNFRYSGGSTLKVFNPGPNNGQTKIIIKNLNPKPENQKTHHNKITGTFH